MNSVELFAGAGGLAMGLCSHGFKPLAIVERDRWACDTIRRNKQRGFSGLVEWPDPFEGDVRTFRYSEITQPVALVSGGPPCQPFSIGGKHRGFNDDRDMFPEAARAVRELTPRAFIFENVRGLLRAAFAEYFEYVLLRLTYPELTAQEGEDWQRHLARLEEHHTSGRERGLVYKVTFRALNAADYGVPQSRVRVFLVGVRADLGLEWSFPDPTHNKERLAWSKWVEGDYWEEHRVPRNRRPSMSPREAHAVDRLRAKAPLPLADDGTEIRRWRTVRDALRGLPQPSLRGTTRALNHWLVPGARAYAGHSGSPYDMPAKTLKAGVHGVPGGENMLREETGSVRYFTVREAARLQTFADDYELEGAWSECMRQLGNAVPVTLAEKLALRMSRMIQRTVGHE